MIDILLDSHHLPAWYCIDIVRRNSAFVTCGSERVNMHEVTRSMTIPPIPEWMAGPSQDYNPAFDQASLTISLVPIYAPWWRVALWEDSFFVQECNTLTWPCHKYGPLAWSPVVSLNILDNCNTPVQSLFFSIAWFKLVHGLLLV